MASCDVNNPPDNGTSTRRRFRLRRTRLWRRVMLGLGLQGKLVVAFSCLLLIGLSTSWYLFISRSTEALSDILGEQARQISQTLAMAAETPYVGGEFDELKRLGRELLKSRNIVLIVFYDAEGKPIASACRDPDLNLPRALGRPALASNTQRLMQVQARRIPSLGDFLQVTAPVFARYHTTDADKALEAANLPRRSARLLGYLTIGLSQNNEQNQIQRVSLLGVSVGLGIFIFSLPIALALVHRIFLPIRVLVSATNRIASGDYDTRVETDRPDDIGRLARSFNGMVNKIREHQVALQVANEGLAEANRRLEEKVRQRTAELQRSNGRLTSEIAEKEDFLRAVSHDLNAPLRNIAGMAAMLLMKYRDKFDEEIIHRLERIRKNVEVETELIGELLELSRIKTRRQKMEPAPIGEIIKDVAELFEEELEEKKIKLIIDTAPLPIVNCERSRLRQVFQNLVDNAIKYMGEGAQREIHVGHRSADEGVEFYVRDTGIGIDPEDLPKVFYIFRRGKNSAEVKVAGKGVGLSSVKSIVETYEGRIRAESEVGVGSTFRFTIDKKFLPGPPTAPQASAA